MVEIFLGTDLSFGLKMWPETDRWLNIVKNYLGLDVIEFNSDFLDPLFNDTNEYMEVAKEIYQACKENNIEINNYFTGEMTHCVNFITHPDERLRKGGIKWCKGAIDIASTMGARAIGSNFNNIPSYIRNDKFLYKKTIDYLMSTLSDLTRYSKEKNLKFLLWEQMYSPSEVPYTIEQTKKYFEKLNSISSLPVKLVIDVGHACCQNFKHLEDDADPYRWIEECGYLAEVIHLQQTDGLASRHWPFTKEYNKKGIIFPELILKSIEKADIDKIYLIFEIFFPLEVNEKTVLSEMVETVKYWRKFLSKYAEEVRHDKEKVDREEKT